MTTMYYEYIHFVTVIFNAIVWCSSYNCVLLIHKHAFSLSSFVDHTWKGSLETRLE